MSSNKEYGGYFSIELSKGNHYYENAGQHLKEVK